LIRNLILAMLVLAALTVVAAPAGATCVDVNQDECTFYASFEWCAPDTSDPGTGVIVGNLPGACIPYSLPATQTCIDILSRPCVIGASYPNGECSHGQGILVVLAGVEAVCVRK
jgi:hypothetical protein